MRTWNCSPRSSWWEEGEKRSASSRMAEPACARERTRSRSLSALPSTSVSRRSFSSCAHNNQYWTSTLSGGPGVTKI